MKKKKPKRAKRPAPVRTHAAPVQIYLSDDQKRKLLQKAEANGRSISEQVRYWVDLEPRKPKAAAAAPVVDPRQVDFTALDAFNSAVSHFVEEGSSAS